MGNKLAELQFLSKLSNASAKSNDSKEVKSDKVVEGAKDDEKSKEKTRMDKLLDDMARNSDKVLNDPALSTSSAASAAASFSTLFSRLTASLDDDSAAADLGDEDEPGAASSSIMEPFLSMLFSKDILYPSLKLMLENFDKYMEERKDKLGEDEMKKCREQKECIAQMCQVYEAMTDSDSSESKSERLKTILDLLEKCGVCSRFLLFFNWI